MSFSRNPLRPLFASIAAVLFISAASLAQTAEQAPPQDFSQVKIKNFGQMDARFFRGAQPKEKDYKALADLGIKTVIDLQAEPKEYERRIVESLGMRYVNIPMIEKTYPKAEHVAEFLKIVDDPETGKFFVHCAGGRHRTGSMGAVYRYEKYGWDFEQV
ncbi:MAG TPA: tyrosine-protein phosphatase, partial [Pyrinomonadaceae bacterium]|nr:tyrosine-protein phosphatase [Pyrinomonadaceae bacterium]